MSQQDVQTSSTREPSRHVFAIVLTAILVMQFLTGLWHIGFPFTDGRFHYNWDPPFWLIHAKTTNDVGIVASAFGVADYHSHPQLIGPVSALWTRFAGYSESSARLLSLILELLATMFLALAARNFLGARRALLFAVIFASLPLVYIYGRMLDQEIFVLTFLGIQLWGLSLIERSDSKAYLLLAIGSLGMTLSDWSGFLFAFSVIPASIGIWGWRGEQASRIRKIAYCSATGAIFGLLLFLVQLHVQTASDGGGSLLYTYYELWLYRAGAGTDIWVQWIPSQLTFLSRNYSIPLFGIALLALVLAMKRTWLSDDERYRKVAALALSVLVAQYVYLLVVPQAAVIHIYYQYFLCVPVTFGLVLFIEYLAHRIDRHRRLRTWMAIAVLVTISTAGYAAYQYYALLFTSSATTVSDIQLIASLKQLPASASVIAVNANDLESSWYQNPNIDYYAGRAIKTYLVTDGFPFTEYLLVPVPYVQDFLTQINELHGFGRSVSATQLRCSKNICLLHLTK